MRNNHAVIRIFIYLFICLAVLPPTVFAYEPPAGGDEYFDLNSPSFLASGASVTDAEAIAASAFNPASGGVKDRFTLAAAYIGLIGNDGSTTGWSGHGGVLEALVPTIFGNLQGGITFVYSPLIGMDIGTFADFRLGYSREIFTSFFLGANAHVKVGSKDIFSLGVSGDIGVLHTPGDLGPFKNFIWGIVFKEAGLPFDPDTADIGDDRSAVPPSFTPGFGFAFNPFETEDIGLRFNTDVFFPSFSSVSVGLGLKFYYQSFLTVKTGFRIDTQQIARADIANRSLFPSFGIQLNLGELLNQDSGRPGSRYQDVKIETSAAPFMNGSWGVGLGTELVFGDIDESGPELDITYPGEQYISPNNDGVQDTLVLPVSIRDESYIGGYSMMITNSGGQEIKQIRNKDERPENKGIAGIIDRIGTADTGISVPESISWDGTDRIGNSVPDGTYFFQIEAWDLKENRTISGRYQISVDSTPPSALIKPHSAENKIFSPNGDGRKDSFTITQEGSRENSWDAHILDSEGNKVRGFTFSSGSPEDVVWDGNNDSGEPAADGVYRYLLKGRDRAGNTFQSSLNGIILNTSPTAVYLAVSRSSFSPNNDGVLDTVMLRPLFTENDGLLNWNISITHQNGTIAAEFEGKEAPPSEITWNGISESGGIEEGLYTAAVRAEYENGNTPAAQSRSFRLDISAPAVSLKLNPEPFSPDNDGVDDEIFISTDIEEESPVKEWLLTIYDTKGKVFDTISGTGQPAPRLGWDGYSNTGELVQSAEDYTMRFEIEDSVGNKAEVEDIIPVDVLVIREDGKLKIRISNITFAPDSPELITADAEKAEKNISILTRIAEILKKYSAYSVRIEGHAVRVHWNDKERGAKEETEELQPLSKARAQRVKDILTEMGIDEERLSTEGLGGMNPIVPHSDLENRWKNRRVEFILLK